MLPVMESRRIVSAYEIDVDWNRTRSTGRTPSSGVCPGCSIGLENVVGAFAQDGMQAAAFSLHLLTFIAAAALAVYSYVATSRRAATNFFGLRIALLFFVA
jgi:hypothetical protein